MNLFLISDCPFDYLRVRGNQAFAGKKFFSSANRKCYFTDFLFTSCDGTNYENSLIREISYKLLSTRQHFFFFLIIFLYYARL